MAVFIKSRNLISTNDLNECYGTTPTILSDSSVFVQNRAVAATSYAAFIPYLKAGTYTLSLLFSSKNTPTKLDNLVNAVGLAKAQSSTVGVPVGGWLGFKYFGKEDMTDVYKSFTFTVPEDCYFLISFYMSSGNAIQAGTDYTITIKDLMLNEGTTALPFEPYGAVKVTPYIKSRNLIPYPYHATTKTQNGVTLTDNGDGTITLNGTATGTAVFELYVNQKSQDIFQAGKTYTVSMEGNIRWCVYINSNKSTDGTKWGEALFSTNVAGDIKTFTAPNDLVGIQFYIVVTKDAGKLENYVVKPMVNEGSQALSYETYGVVKTKAYLKSRNLFDVSKVNTRAGEITNNGDGTLTIHKYLSGNGNKLKDLCPTLKAGKEATLSFVTGGDNFVAFWSSDLGSFTWSNGKTYMITENLLNAYMYWYTLNTDRETPVIMKDIMMNYGSTKPYEPYLLEV